MRNDSLDLLFDLPGSLRVQSLLDVFEFCDERCRRSLRDLLAEREIARQHFSFGTESRRDDFLDGAAAADGHLLNQPRDSHTRTARNLAVVGGQLAADQFHQRRFAAAVATHQSDSLTPLNLQTDLFQQGRAAVAETGLAQTHQCHERPQSRRERCDKIPGFAISRRALAPVGSSRTGSVLICVARHRRRREAGFGETRPHKIRNQPTYESHTRTDAQFGLFSSMNWR